MADSSHLAPSTLSPIDFLGLPLHALTMDASLDYAETLIRSGEYHQHVVLNAAKVVQASKDLELATIIRSCSLVNADGQAVVWAAKILGHPIPERVAGIDFMLRMCERAAVRGYRVYFLGAEAEVAAAVAEWAERHDVTVAGHHDGFWTADQEEQIVSEIRQSSTDVLFLAIPSPQKEEFLSLYRGRLNVPLVVGVGGSFDIIAGVRERAPQWMQRMGCEWVFRLKQEPRRMARRYAEGNTKFILLVLKAYFRNKRRSRRISTT